VYVQMDGEQAGTFLRQANGGRAGRHLCSIRNMDGGQAGRHLDKPRAIPYTECVGSDDTDKEQAA